MLAADILTILEDEGCQLRVESGRLIIRDPKHALTDALREQIQQHKNEILSVLTRQDDRPPQPCIASCNPCHASDIITQGPVCVCKVCKLDWLLPCPECQGQSWGMPRGRWTCKECGYEWLTAIDSRQDVKTASQIIRHPDGHEMTIAIYKCPSCQGTNWGPNVHDPDTWVCLTCYSNPGNE